MQKSKIEALNPIDPSGAAVGKGSIQSELSEAHGIYTVECFGPDGLPKWNDQIENIVTTVGKNDALDKYLVGSAYTAAFYLGLISITSYVSVPVIADTMASHATWAEDQNYSQAARPTTAWSAAAAGAKALSAAAVFSINASTTIKGCFLTTISTKGGATGILYSAGLFTGGDKVVANGDTLNVSYTASM
jgi:hypothetical protein